MTKVKLWTRNFMALVWANGLLFAGFHFLLPTLPLYAASIGATGTEIGIITGIFGFSAIFIRLFTDTYFSISRKRWTGRFVNTSTLSNNEGHFQKHLTMRFIQQMYIVLNGRF